MYLSKYLTEKNLYILSGLVVLLWMIFAPDWEPVAVFIVTCAVIKGLSAKKTKEDIEKISNQLAIEKEDLRKEFDSFNNEIRNSLAFLVGHHLNDQDSKNKENRMEKMWQEYGQGNKDIFIDYIIHALMEHNSERCIFQIFNIVNTDCMISEQLVKKIDYFILTAEKHELENYFQATKLFQLYKWLISAQHIEVRRKLAWSVYV